MPKIAANLNFLFTEMPLLDRVEAAADAGFQAVEVLFPYELSGVEITSRLSRFGLKMVLINTPPPNYTGGPRGFAAVIGGEARFQHDFKRCLRYAKLVKADHVHIMAGAAEGAEAKATMIENLRWAATFAPEQSLTIEPINQGDLPGYFLNDFSVAADIIAQVDCPNLGLQFDTHHAKILTGDVLKAWENYGHLVRHVQISGFDGRHEPTDPHFNFTNWLNELKTNGYTGWFSAEYHPKERTDQGLSWLTACQ